MTIRAQELLTRDIIAALRSGIAASGYVREGDIRWPSLRYQHDPVGFARDILGLTMWDRQEEILNAYRDHKRVSVVSGHKIGKSTSGAAIALHWYCTYPDARIIMTAPTALQVDKILWREVKRLKNAATIPIDGDMAVLARTGLKSGLREIYGFTANEKEAVAGISGANLLYIIDEASGINDEIFEAIEGNRAGGARVIMFSNPTRTDGEFAQSFREKKHLYHTIQISSEESPNVHDGRIVIPGLATREWIQEKKEEWGEDSPTYKIRIKGEFVYKEEGKICSLHNILAAVDRWDGCENNGDLQLGVDIAGDGTDNDETVVSVRRGRKIIQIYRRRGLNIPAIVSFVAGVVDQYRNGNEPVSICVDREGALGFDAWKQLLHWGRSLPTTRQVFVYGVRASDKAVRQPHAYDRVRDELWACVADWLRTEGCIPDDAKLQAELHCPSWRQLINGRMKATSKDDMRKELNRSPDTADSVALAVWLPSLRDEQRNIETDTSIRERVATERRFDPYGYGKTWVRK